MSLATDGYEIVESVFKPAEVAKMIANAEASFSAEDRGGDRNALSWPWVREIAQDERMQNLADRALGGAAFPVRGILFDKTPGANWNLGFHQDRALALAERHETEGFVGWSEKDGVPHAIAPASVLERMVALRISLDDCGPENGPLRVIPGSHLKGLWPKGQLPEVPEVACTVNAGGIVLMKPLTLHASSAAVSPGHRRVLHIEYFTGILPDGLRFYPW